MRRRHHLTILPASELSSPMTDIALAASPTATPLSTWLAGGDPQTQTAIYRGVITPVQLDAPAAESAALLTAAAVHDLGWLRRIKVRGEDRFRWLSGMVTNSVNDLPPNGGAWNLVLNAQGRIQGDVTVWRKGDKLEIELTVEQYDRLLAHFEHYIIMDDVELVPHEDETALGLTGPQAGEVLTRLGLPALPEPMTHVRADWNGLSIRIRRGFGVLGEHYTLWTKAATVAKVWKYLLTGGASAAGYASLEAFRIAEGIPAYAIDIQERDLPQETSQTRALHFSKGCYLGQEIVERIRSRGNVHRHLRHLELDGPLPAPGAELTQDGAPAGHITSAAELPFPLAVRRFALAMIRAEAEARNLPLTYADSQTARLLPTPPTL
jgi:folate-binding protein YgfZ